MKYKVIAVKAPHGEYLHTVMGGLDKSDAVFLAASVNHLLRKLGYEGASAVAGPEDIEALKAEALVLTTRQGKNEMAGMDEAALALLVQRRVGQ